LDKGTGAKETPCDGGEPISEKPRDYFYRKFGDEGKGERERERMG
jgi:hypothetical protein